LTPLAATALAVVVPLLGALTAALLGVAWRSRRWFIGRPARVAFWSGLLRLPARYLGPVHAATARAPYTFSARMHQLAAGGVVASVPLALLYHLTGWGGTALGWAVMASAGGAVIGGLMAWKRRNPKPVRLSGGPYRRLPWALMSYGGGLGWLTWISLGHPEAMQHFTVATGFFAWGALELIAGMAFGAMKHAANGALHLIAHPRPDRFDGNTGAAAALRPLDLEAGETGVGTPGDFAWNHLLGFDACVECGRCKEACPAIAAGQPLNPKKLIQVLAASPDASGRDVSYRSTLPHPRGRRIEPAAGGADRPIVGAMLHPDTLWACTTCRACVEACPMMIEHVDAIVDLRRHVALGGGEVPGKAADALANLKRDGTVAGKGASNRTDFAASLAPRVLAAGAETDVLLWLGEAAFEPRGQRTLAALMTLLQRAGVDFAVLGTTEADCGDLARRLGDEATFQDLARRNIEALGSVTFRRIVTADPHALHVLRNEYPAFGGNYEVIHHTTLLAGLVDEGRLPVTPGNTRSVTYHDPCYLGRYNGEYEAPRKLMSAIGATPTEMAKNRAQSHCCGWGGGAAYTEVEGEHRIADQRMEQARETGADVVAVACPNCAWALDGIAGPRPEVRDVAELLLDAVGVQT